MEERNETRQVYHAALDRLTQEVLAMGVLVEEAIRRALDGLCDGDLESARAVVSQDAAVNRLQTEIEDMAIALVATEQPVAKDLRRLVTGLKAVTQLERMGDHAVHVAKAALELGERTAAVLPPQIRQMGKLGHDMLRDALRALVDNDSAKTLPLAEMDRRVDLLYHQALEELTGRMRQDGAQVEASLRLVSVCRDLERLADHATNIGEWIVYGETARHVELNP